MKIINSIKQQTIVMFASFTIGLALMYSTLAIIAAFMVEDELIARFMNLEASHIEEIYQKNGKVPDSRMDFIAVYETESSLPEFVQIALKHGISDNEIFTPTNDHYHVKSLKLGENKTGYLVAEVSPLLIVSTTPQIFKIFAWGLAFTMLIAFFLAYKMASYTVKPVMAITAAVKSNLPIPKQSYELGYLADTLQNAFDESSLSLKREKDFTTDVSHELRTPLTVLNNTITLAKQRGINDNDLLQLEQVGEQLQHTIEVLLALARVESSNIETPEQHSLSSSKVFLKTIFEQVGMQCALAKGVELDMQLNMEDDFSVLANPTLVNLLATNLINNAISHGKNNQLNINVFENQLIFSNSSDNPIQQDVSNSGVRSLSSDGIGQGLYLVTRIVESIGWQHYIQQNNSEFSVIISL